MPSEGTPVSAGLTERELRYAQNLVRSLEPYADDPRAFIMNEVKLVLSMEGQESAAWHDFPTHEEMQHALEASRNFRRHGEYTIRVSVS